MLEGQKTKIKRNTNQVDKVQNTYSNTQKYKAQGGNLNSNTYRLSNGQLLNFSSNKYID